MRRREVSGRQRSTVEHRWKAGFCRFWALPGKTDLDQREAGAGEEHGELHLSAGAQTKVSSARRKWTVVGPERGLD